MRETLTKKKQRLAEDLKLLQPVTPKGIDFVASKINLRRRGLRRIICFDAANGKSDTDRRLVFVVFAENGKCHILDSDYDQVETVKHGIDLATEIRRTENLRNVKCSARMRELEERLFIHFIDSINPHLEGVDEGWGRYVMLAGGWDGKDVQLDAGMAAILQSHLEMAVWSDPDLPASASGYLRWDGLPPSTKEESSYEEDWISCWAWKDSFLNSSARADFERFSRALKKERKSESLSIRIEAALTDRLIAALWVLRWQFGGLIVAKPEFDWEYYDGDHFRQGGYGLEPCWTPIEFPIRQPTNAERAAAQLQFIDWRDRLYLHSLGWRRLSDRLVEYNGDDWIFTEEEFAEQRRRFLEVEAGRELLRFRGPVYVPSSLGVKAA